MKFIISFLVACQLGLALSQEGGTDLSEFSKYTNNIITIDLLIDIILVK